MSKSVSMQLTNWKLNWSQFYSWIWQRCFFPSKQSSCTCTCSGEAWLFFRTCRKISYSKNCFSQVLFDCRPRQFSAKTKIEFSNRNFENEEKILHAISEARPVKHGKTDRYLATANCESARGLKLRLKMLGSPVQVVKINDDDHSFTLDEEALNNILNRDEVKDKPLAVVSVAGTNCGPHPFSRFWLAESRLRPNWLTFSKRPFEISIFWCQFRHNFNDG